MQTTTAAAYSAVVRPLTNTVYTVKAKNASSQAVTVKVRPRVRLGKVASHRYSLRVLATQSFAGKYGTFQRYKGTSGAGSASSACSCARTQQGSRRP